MQTGLRRAGAQQQGQGEEKNQKRQQKGME